MRGSLALLGTALVLAGCGAEGAPRKDDGANEPVAAAHGPDDPPPQRPRFPPGSRAEGPPPAWVDTGEERIWLAYSTFCWGTACADYLAPRCGDERVPDLSVERGAVLTFHLGFEPEEVSLETFADRRGGKPVRLAPTRAPTWAAGDDGVLLLFARARGGGDASYVACLRFRGDSRAPAASEALTVEQVFAAGFTGEPILVEGSLYVEGGVTRLCSGFRESYPPQCMEPSLVLEGFALASVNGLQQASGVRWSDTPFRVRGEMRDGTLVVLDTAN